MTKRSDVPFKPDWASPPGGTISDLMDEHGWNQVELARRLDVTEKHLSHLINGKVPLSPELASRIVTVLGGSFEFWMNREARYREHLLRLERESEWARQSDWLDRIPHKTLMDYELIPKRRITVDERPKVMDEILSYVKVASPRAWDAHKTTLLASYRQSQADKADTDATFTWLMIGERMGKELTVGTYDPKRFGSILPEIRALTVQGPKVFEPNLRRLFSESGVRLLFVPPIPKARVSGVARWLSPDSPMIQLSLFGKTNDRFWFNLFHEAAHILLHSEGIRGKRHVFMDDFSANDVDLESAEIEANRFATDTLIPPHHANRLSSLRSEYDVIRFAADIGIHPGIVVGRLQHEKVIPASHLNHLKVSFRIAPSDR